MSEDMLDGHESMTYIAEGLPLYGSLRAIVTLNAIRERLEEKESTSLTDDNDAIDSLWLKRLGFGHCQDNDSWSFSGLHMKRFYADDWRWQIGGRDNFYETLNPPTRGSVRIVLRLLGVDVETMGVTSP